MLLKDDPTGVQNWSHLPSYTQYWNDENNGTVLNTITVAAKGQGFALRTSAQELSFRQGKIIIYNKLICFYMINERTVN